MKLGDLAAALGDSALILAHTDRKITGIESDSRRVLPGDLFVSIAGSKVDGLQFIDQALERGAVAVVAQRDFTVPEGIGAVLVPDSRFALSALADKLYGSVWRKLKTVGITGTNGKTTTAFLVKAITEAAGRQCGVIGTAGMVLGTEVVEEKGHYTTPEAHDLHRLLATMVERQADVVAMEVSSHALEQHRVAHCRFDVAVYTNLTHEHLDYHQDMESYYQAKAKLFRMLRPGAFAVINLDDPYGERMVSEVPRGVHVLTYGFHRNAAVRAEAVELSAAGTVYRLITPVGDTVVEAPFLFGAYNVSNALAAIATGMGLGFGVSPGVMALRTAKGAPGRFERVDLGQDFTVIVDYAHTPDGFEKLLAAVERIKPTGSRLTMVFGSAGHRDKLKRPVMGRIAGNYADVLILTEEDPRTESAREISQQIAAGVQRLGVDVQLTDDRLEAIDAAIRMANPGDIVLVTGKGNETELEVQHPTAFCGDVPAVEEALRRLLSDPTRRRVTA